MSSVDERLARLRGLADAAPERVGTASLGVDWARVERAVMAGFALRRRQIQARRQMAWTGALALAVGLAGGLSRQEPMAHAVGARDGGYSQDAGPLALPPQAPSVVLLGAG